MCQSHSSDIVVAGTATPAGVASLLASVKGLPEVGDGASLTTLTA